MILKVLESQIEIGRVMAFKFSRMAVGEVIKDEKNHEFEFISIEHIYSEKY